MSYEGYVQCLCEDGHYSVCDAYYHGFGEDQVCSICGKPIVWENDVDETNGAPEGEIPLERLKVKKEAEKCSCCGAETKPAMYEIPSKEETEKMRVWYDFIDEYDSSGELPPKKVV
jgi:hypothetical protein